jgi:phosphonoacetaldehyde hydrolase
MFTDKTNIRLVVFDWAGTTIDHGCCAPVAAFVETFARHGVAVTPAEVRGPMGLDKKDHLRALLQTPELAERWRRAHGRYGDEQDVESLYREFVPCQLEVIGRYSQLAPGLLDCVAELRRAGIWIGATTGYFAEAAERVYEAAARQGFVPDYCVCAEDVPAGRPAPWMLYRIMEALDVYPPAAVVKVGDTVPDIGEGRNAGAWSVGVTRTSSEVGCTEDEFDALSGPERQGKLAAARRKLLAAGAHAVFESVADLPTFLQGLSARLRAGEMPGPPFPGRR